jgi:hypothetical protein
MGFRLQEEGLRPRTKTLLYFLGLSGAGIAGLASSAVQVGMWLTPIIATFFGSFLIGVPGAITADPRSLKLTLLMLDGYCFGGEATVPLLPNPTTTSIWCPAPAAWWPPASPCGHARSLRPGPGRDAPYTASVPLARPPGPSRVSGASVGTKPGRFRAEPRCLPR